MKIRIWMHGEAVDMYADQWVILPDRSLIGVRKTAVDSVFHCWEKIEVWPDAM